MPRFGKWVLTLGLMAATPAAAVAAGPFDNPFAGQSKPAASQTSQTNRTNPSNQQVAEAIAKALRSAKLNRYEMDVEYANGVCTLSGKVGTPQQKAEATRIVSQIAGVNRVDNRLQPLSSGVRRAAYAPATQRTRVRLTNGTGGSTAVSNQQMAEAVARSLQSAGLSGYNMEIQYQNGVALLAGTVSSDAHRAQAGQIASQVPGVTSVSNQLLVASVRQPAANPAFNPGVNPARYSGQPVPVPPAYMHPGPGAQHTVYNSPNMPDYSVPTYSSYPNYASYTYPKMYSASAWPYIGPFYPYPQVPLGWRKASLEWDDGYWALSFSSRTDRWWWFLNPKNW